MARIHTNPKILRLILALFAGFILLAGVVAFLLLHKTGTLAHLPTFPIETYMEGRNLWNHEDYKIEGRIDNVILRSASGETLLVAIQPAGSDLRLPVLLAKRAGKVPVQREQNVILKVSLGSASEIQCKEYELK